MANKTTVNRRVNLYINGKEAGNDIKSVRGEMQKLINEQARMKIGSDEYVAHAKRIRELRGVMDQHNRQLQNTTQQWFSMGKAVDVFNKYSGVIIGILGSLTGVVLGFRKCSDEAGKFEENLDNLSALTGLEGKNLDWLGQQAKEMSVKTTDSGIKIKQSATDILDAFTKMGSQRPELLKNKEALAAVTEDAIILSEASKMKLEPATASLANVMNQFNSKSSESRRIINELAAGSQAGSGDIQYLSDAIEKCGTSAYLMGMKTNETIGVVEAVAPKFKEASMAGNGLDKVLLKMKEKQIGYKSGVFNLNDALDELQTRFARGESSAELFGVEHAKMAEVLVMAKNDVIRYTAAVTGTDKAQEQAAKNTNNRVTERAQAMNRLKLKMIEAGEQIAPAITMSTNTFTYFLNTLLKAPQIYNEHKRLIFVLIAAFVALQGKTILANASILKSKAAHLLDAAAKMKNALATQYATTYTEQYNKTQGRLYPALLKARTGFIMLGRAMMANPIGTVILAFTALKEAIQFYDRNNAESIRLEKAKQEVMGNLDTAVGTLSGTYKTYQEQLSKLNRLSSQEKRDLREKIALTIQQTEAELIAYEARQTQLKKDNTKVGVWDTVWTSMTTFHNPFSKDLGMGTILNALGKQAEENGQKVADELNPQLEKLRETLTGLKQQGNGLDDIFNAETNADKIGSGTITELQEKVNLYSVALENAKVESEEYERVQRKLTATQKQLNKAISARVIPEHEDKKSKKNDNSEKKNAEKLAADKAKAEADLAEKLKEIRQDLNMNALTGYEKEVAAVEQKYASLLQLCKQYKLELLEVERLRTEELLNLYYDEMEREQEALEGWREKARKFKLKGREKEKEDIREHYRMIIAEGKVHNENVSDLEKERDEKLAEVDKKQTGMEKLFGLSEEESAALNEKISLALDVAGQLSDIWGQFNQIQANRDKKELQEYEKGCNKKKELLNKQLNSGRISQEKYNAQVAQIDADMEKKKTEMARKQAKRDKAQAIFSSMINTASAIVQALNGPWPASIIFAALAGAMGAMQLGVIMSTPLPEYAVGGMTDGARVYVAGEAGQEWIAPNGMLEDPVTGPIIQQLELVRTGVISPRQLVPDFQTMTSVPMYAAGGFTSLGQNMVNNNYYSTSTMNPDSEALNNMREDMRLLREYLSDPRNRNAVISNDLLQKNTAEKNMMDRLKRLG